MLPTLLVLLLPEGPLRAADIADQAGVVLLREARSRCACPLVREVEGVADGARIRLRIEGPARVGEVVVLDGARPALSGDPSGWTLFADGRTMNDLPQVVAGSQVRVRGQGVTAMASTDAALAIGSVSGEAGLEVEVEDGRIRARFDLGDLELAPGEARELEVQVLRAATLGSALEGWSRLALPAANASRPRRGWCSWYSQPQPGQDYVLSQLEPARELGLEVIQIDDGWQRAVGDWRPNERFPDGMAALASAIRARGLVPGIWIAPFLAAEDSPVAREHPGWLLRGKDGQPLSAGDRPEWGGRLVRLDPSHPGVVDWLADLGARLSRDWGFSYLKLDFLHLGIDAARADRRLTPLAAWRRALAALGAALAPGSYQLACDAPIAGSIGLFDAMRSGPDAQLGSARQALTLAASVRRSFWRRAFVLDPDVVRAAAPMGLDQAAARAAFPILFAGAWFAGDDLHALDEERRRLVRAALGSESGALAPAPHPGTAELRRRELDGVVARLVVNPGPAPTVVTAGVALSGARRLVDPAEGESRPELELGPGALRLLFELDPGRPAARSRIAPLRALPVAPEPDALERLLAATASGDALWVYLPDRCPSPERFTIGGRVAP